MESGWVDFKAVKAAVNIQAVLAHYQVAGLKKTGDEWRGRCPIHKGEGQDAFHVNVAKGAFQCFSCRARGNVLDFVAAMEQCSVRDAAIKLADWFQVGSPETVWTKLAEQAEQVRKQRKWEPGRATRRVTQPAATAESGEAAPAENKPLGFELKGIDPAHPYLAGRGISKETAELFGVGFFSGKGSMAGRVVIPIHKGKGELVAYAGRAIDSSEPRYKFPAGFQKSVELYNLHRAVEDNPARVVVVVEGFFDCLKLYQAGFPAVALMGCSMSDRQEELLAAHFQAAWLLLDGDGAGRAAAVECAARLVRRIFLKLVSLADGQQPDMLAPDEVRTVLK